MNKRERDSSTTSKLVFSPSTLTVQPGKTASIDVALLTEGTVPDIAQLEIAYDPQILTNMQIIPGKFFLNPVILIDDINERTGRISFIIQTSTDEPKINNKEGSIATLSFSTKPSLLRKETTLSFLPKTAIRIKGDMNILQSTGAGKILLDSSPSASFQ